MSFEGGYQSDYSFKQIAMQLGLEPIFHYEIGHRKVRRMWLERFFSIDGISLAELLKLSTNLLSVFYPCNTGVFDF